MAIGAKPDAHFYFILCKVTTYTAERTYQYIYPGNAGIIKGKLCAQLASEIRNLYTVEINYSYKRLLNEKII